MQLRQIISPNSVVIDPISQSKTAVLFKISKILSRNVEGLDPQELFECYWKRETLGSTAIGHGVTIPHVRINKHIQPCACFIKLIKPVDFGAADKQPIDLVVGLLMPQELIEQHLKILANISQLFSHHAFRSACRCIKNSQELFELLFKNNLLHEELIA